MPDRTEAQWAARVRVLYTEREDLRRRLAAATATLRTVTAAVTACYEAEGSEPWAHAWVALVDHAAAAERVLARLDASTGHGGDR